MAGVSTTPYAILDGKHFPLAIDEISSKFQRGASGKKAERAHDDIAAPLQNAARGGSTPTLIADFKLASTDGDTMRVLRVGNQAFPILYTSLDGRERELRLLPPVSAEQLDYDDLRQGDVAALYGQKTDSWRKSTITLRRSKGMETRVRIGNDGAWTNNSYAWALWETAAGLLRMAASKASREGDSFDAGATETIGAAQSFDQTVRGDDFLAALFSAPQHAPDWISGPPPGLADNLVDVCSWRGLPVIGTSQTDPALPTTVWIASTANGSTVWQPIPWPEVDDLPTHGVSMAVRGDTLHIIGGTDSEGTPVSQHWTYCLRDGASTNFDATPWSRAMSLSTPAAWAAVANARDGLYLVGGVSGFYAQELPEADTPETRIAAQRHGARILRTWGETRLSDAPGYVSRASTCAAPDAFFIGPGNSLDGNFYMYDTTRASAWYVLPPLPGGGGLGQIREQDSTLIYSGGFDADGNASDAVWTLKLDKFSARWERTGSSPYVTGLARVFEWKGRLASMMLTPDASRCFFLS